ncbi:MAG TPA: TonB-dependent receptor [Azospirillaceae bacterium]|nr:TonB-dependent receptor [Azospirillaceae bacterium]
MSAHHIAARMAALLLATVAPLAAPPAAAQEAPQELKLEEIVVTARRTEERLQDVPVAVTALGGEALRRLDATTLGDIQDAVPNLTLHVGDASNAVVYIRGVGQIDSLAFADPGVGIYLDDVYLGRAQGAFLDVFDVQRIEVLRGPQGTLYGRNTIGGAVKFVSNQPDFTPAGRLEATVGDYDRLDLKGMVGGGLIEGKVAAKASFAYLKRDGYADNAFAGRDDGDKDTVAGRLAVLLTPTERFSLQLAADGSSDTPDTSRTPSRETAVFGVAQPNEDPFEVDANFNDLNKLKVRGVAATAAFEASDAVTLKSVTAYRMMDYDTHLDLDATRLDFFGVYVNEDQNQFSQEFQATFSGDRFEGVAGLYFFREHDETISGLFGPAISLVTGSLNDQTNRSYAAYGQGSYTVTDALSVTGGLRYTYEEKDFRRTQEFFAPTATLPIALGTGLRITDIDTADDWASLSPKLGLDYRFTDLVMGYLSASRGFKSGGFDGRSNNAAQAASFDPETMWSYEAGVKSTLWENRVTLNVAAFWNDYRNLQLSSFVADQSGQFAALFTNAGAATMRGVDVELNALVAEGLTVSATLGFLDSEYDRYAGPGGVDISGQRELVNAPRWSGRLGASYSLPLSFGDLTLDGDVAYRSKTYPTVSSSEVLAQDGYALVNLQATLEFGDGAWAVSGGVKNLTDKRYISHGFDLSDSLGYQLGYYGDPRTWSLSLRHRF